MHYACLHCKSDITKVTITSLSICWCCSSRVCLATARSQSFCHWLTSWQSCGVWGSRCSRGTGTTGCILRVLLLSGWRNRGKLNNICFMINKETSLRPLVLILTYSCVGTMWNTRWLTCKRPLARRHMLFGNALEFAALCGLFNLWKLFIQLLHEYLERRNNSENMARYAQYPTKHLDIVTMIGPSVQ